MPLTNRAFRDSFGVRARGWRSFTALSAVDMHQENIIAAGEYPVPIDLEMILMAADASGRPDDSPEGAL